MAEWGFSTVGLFRTMQDMKEIPEGLQTDKKIFVGVDLKDPPAGAPYAPHVEFGEGPGEREPQPFRRPAMASASKTFGAWPINPFQEDSGDQLVELIAEHIMLKMKEFAPVDTGNLMDNIYMEEID